MKIGIDGRSLNTNRAIFRYTKNLLNSLSEIDKENEYLLFMEGDQPLNEIKYLNLSINWRLVKAPHKMVLKDHFLFHNFIKRFNLDLFFHPDNTEFLSCHPRSVVAVHDLIPYLLPELSLSSNPLVRKRQDLYFYLQRKAIINSSSHIVTMSNNSKKDLVNIFGIKNDSISVTYESVEAAYRPVSKLETLETLEKYGVSGDYIFCHSGFSPYKNVLRLVEAFFEFSKYNPGVLLVLGGAYQMDDSYYKEINGVLGKYLLHDKVIFTGYIPEEQLPAIYSGALLFVYPSMYEGFGIPLLEAQACGVPVVCSNTASLPEVVGSSAVVFDPLSVADMAEKLAKVYANEGLRRELVEAGFTNVKRFSWERCARETLKVFEDVYKFVKI